LGEETENLQKSKQKRGKRAISTRPNSRGSKNSDISITETELKVSYGLTQGI
jgi:hypothetical protein